MPTPVPADLQVRLSALIARMTARGMTEPIQVYAMTTQLDGNSHPVARARTLLATLTGYVATGGGAFSLAQEGTRANETHQLYFLPDPSLTDSNFTERWIVLPNRSNRFHRVEDLQTVGPYVWGSINAGGTADVAGNVK